MSDIPPEWRSWNPLGWKSYRDSHEYERVSSVNFALNLDKAEVYTPIWGGADWQDFYLIVDAWDNIHDYDSDAPDVTIAADVTIVTTSRSLILPPYTVALTFMVVLLGALAAPFILNARYMKAGLAHKDASEGLVPSLELPADLPQFGQEPTSPTMPVAPMPQTIGQPNSPLPDPLPVASVPPQAVQLLTTPPPEPVDVPSGDEFDL